MRGSELAPAPNPGRAGDDEQAVLDMATARAIKIETLSAYRLGGARPGDPPALMLGYGQPAIRAGVRVIADSSERREASCRAERPARRRRR
jgi:hypothetical protein